MPTEFRVRYKGQPNGLIVALIYTWTMADFPHGAIMSASSGPKDYIKNNVWTLFEREPTVEAVYMVRANGPAFLLKRKGLEYFDMTGRQVEVAQRKQPARPGAVRPAESA